MYILGMTVNDPSTKPYERWIEWEFKILNARHAQV